MKYTVKYKVQFIFNMFYNQFFFQKKKNYNVYENFNKSSIYKLIEIIFKIPFAEYKNL